MEAQQRDMFVLGLFTGAMIGVALMCLLNAGGK
jgi:hypothetical protein